MYKTLFLMLCAVSSVFSLNAAYLADEQMKPINPGDNIYIYGINALTGYSVDYDESVFHSVRTRQENDRIYIGRLKDNLTPGLTSLIILNTQKGSEELMFTVVPEFLSILLDKQILSEQDSLKGNVVFASNGKTSGAGIDSMFLIVHSEKGSTRVNRIFHTDTIVDYDFTAGMFEFTLMPFEQKDNFTLSIAFYSGELSDTVYYAEGFSTESIDDYGTLLFIVDTRSSITYEKLRDQYSFSEASFYSTFYRGVDSRIFDNGFDMLCIVSIEGGQIMSNYKNVKHIVDEAAEKPVFVFAPELGRILTYDENSEDLDSISSYLNVTFSETGTDDFYGFRTLDSYKTSYAEHGDAAAKPYILQGNLNIFLFLPENLEFSDLKRISVNNAASMQRDILGSFTVIDTVYNEEYNEFSIDIYDTSGRFVKTVILGNLPFGRNILNVTGVLHESGDLNAGQYFYSLRRSGQWLKSGSIILVH